MVEKEKRRMYRNLVNRNEGVKVFYDEDCEENEEGEWRKRMKQ